MRDFRERLVQHPPSESQIRSILQKGHLKKALRKARSAGIHIRQEEIDTVAKAMFLSGRAGELLSMDAEIGIEIPYDATTLLIRAFEKKDYHNFLKHGHRLGLADEHMRTYSGRNCSCAR